MTTHLNFDPLNNISCTSETIHLRVIKPTPNNTDADPTDIKFICKLLRITDFDFPLVDYNFKTNTWIIVPGTDGRDETGNSGAFIIWKNCNVNVSTCIRFFRQFGWEVIFPMWKKA